MKQLRLFLLLAAGLFLTSCSEPQPEEFPNPDPPPTVGRHAVPIDQALGELDNLLGVIDGQGTRAGGVRTVAQVQTLHAQALPLTRSAGEPSEQPEELLYVVNFEDDAGYAVLGADDRLPAVLAVTDEGSLTTEELVRAANGQTAPEEFTFPNEMLMNYVSGIGGIGGGGIGGGGIGGGGGIPTGPITDLGWQQGPVDITFTGNTVDEWKPVEYTPPRTRTKWGQNAPFNAYCPAINGQKCVTGCVAVATAQILCANKYEYGLGPDKIGSYRIDWPSVFKAIEDPTLLSEKTTPPTPEALAVAYLIRGCGREAGMTISDYGIVESSAPSSGIIFIGYYGYTFAKKINFTAERAYHMVVTCGYPTIVKADGKKVKEDGKGHHAWVIDGWLVRTRNMYANFIDGSQRFVGTQTQTLVHCNFGWNGTADGYYFPGQFNTFIGPSAREPDDPTLRGGTNYNNNIDILMYNDILPI